MQNETQQLKTDLLQAIAELPSWEQAEAHLQSEDAREVFSAFREFYKRDILFGTMEMRSPISSIKALASLLDDQDWMRENNLDLADMKGHIEKAADRLTDIVNVMRERRPKGIL